MFLGCWEFSLPVPSLTPGHIASASFCSSSSYSSALLGFWSSSSGQLVEYLSVLFNTVVLGIR